MLARRPPSAAWAWSAEEGEATEMICEPLHYSFYFIQRDETRSVRERRRHGKLSDELRGVAVVLPRTDPPKKKRRINVLSRHEWKSRDESWKLNRWERRRKRMKNSQDVREVYGRLMNE